MSNLSLMPVEEGFELLLDNKEAFIGFQFDVELGEGAAINDVRLAGDDDHVLTYWKLGNGKSRWY